MPSPSSAVPAIATPAPKGPTAVSRPCVRSSLQKSVEIFQPHSSGRHAHPGGDSCGLDDGSRGRFAPYNLG